MSPEGSTARRTRYILGGETARPSINPWYSAEVVADEAEHLTGHVQRLIPR